jgi:hypothetical protein
LRLATGIKVYLARQLVDAARLRRVVGGGCARALAADPFSGAAFVFRGKRSATFRLQFPGWLQNFRNERLRK